MKGGFTVDLDGAVAFLPGSQVDVRPMRDVGPLMNQPQLFQILKMDRRRGNIVVSRRAVLEERRAEERTSLVASLAEKQVVEGVVKNITDYGAFVDLGGVDGLLHVTDIAWRASRTRRKFSPSARPSPCRSSRSTTTRSASRLA
ncbi:MAG: S1 RNA-binding domain-containing protein [Rhizomicrobium sp.]